MLTKKRRRRHPSHNICHGRSRTNRQGRSTIRRKNHGPRQLKQPKTYSRRRHHRRRPSEGRRRTTTRTPVTLKKASSEPPCDKWLSTSPPPVFTPTTRSTNIVPLVSIDIYAKTVLANALDIAIKLSDDAKYTSSKDHKIEKVVKKVPKDEKADVTSTHKDKENHKAIHVNIDFSKISPMW